MPEHSAPSIFNFLKCLHAPSERSRNRGSLSAWILDSAAGSLDRPHDSPTTVEYLYHNKNVPHFRKSAGQGQRSKCIKCKVTKCRGLNLRKPQPGAGVPTVVEPVVVPVPPVAVPVQGNGRRGGHQRCGRFCPKKNTALHFHSSGMRCWFSGLSK